MIGTLKLIVHDREHLKQYSVTTSQHQLLRIKHLNNN